MANFLFARCTMPFQFLWQPQRSRTSPTILSLLSWSSSLFAHVLGTFLFSFNFIVHTATTHMCVQRVKRRWKEKNEFRSNHKKIKWWPMCCVCVPNLTFPIRSISKFLEKYSRASHFSGNTYLYNFDSMFALHARKCKEHKHNGTHFISFGVNI